MVAKTAAFCKVSIFLGVPVENKGANPYHVDDQAFEVPQERFEASVGQYHLEQLGEICTEIRVESALIPSGEHIQLETQTICPQFILQARYEAV